MRRREFVAAMAATSGALAGCGQLSDGADSGGDAGPVTVETLDAPGSQSVRVTVPSPAEHGGEWPVALDDGLTLSERYDATAVPTAVVVRPDGAVAWSHTGSLDASTIVRNVRDARQGDQP